MLKPRCLIAISIVTTLGASACSSTRTETTAEECERVREHLIRIELPLADNKREAHARVMRRAMGDAFVDGCSRSMTTMQRQCVLDATDSKVAMACISKAGKSAVATKGTKK